MRNNGAAVQSVQRNWLTVAPWAGNRLPPRTDDCAFPLSLRQAKRKIATPAFYPVWSDVQEPGSVRGLLWSSEHQVLFQGGAASPCPVMPCPAGVPTSMYCVVLYCAVLCCTVLCFVVLSCTNILYCTVLGWTGLHHTAL